MPGQLQPQLVKLDRLRIQAELAKGMDVAIAQALPIDELDAELERALRVADELVFIEAQQRIERQQRRNRRFANTDRADLLRFDQPYGYAGVLDQTRQPRRAHPSGSTAAYDHNFSHRPR